MKLIYVVDLSVGEAQSQICLSGKLKSRLPASDSYYPSAGGNKSRSFYFVESAGSYVTDLREETPRAKWPDVGTVTSFRFICFHSLASIMDIA